MFNLVNNRWLGGVLFVCLVGFYLLFLFYLEIFLAMSQAQQFLDGCGLVTLWDKVCIPAVPLILEQTAASRVVSIP